MFARRSLLKQRKPLAKKRLLPRRDEGRVQHGRVKRKLAPTDEERRHLDRVAAMPCIVTGKRPIHVHHVMHMPGKCQRRDHRFVVPLSPDLHNMGDQSVHALGGEDAFYQVHGVDLRIEAVRLWTETTSG